MKKKTLPAREARKLAESILKKDSRLKSLFRLYDMTIDAWSPETDFKSSKSVKFEELDEPTKLIRGVRGETVKFDTYEFMLNDLHVQFGKHYGQNDLCDLDISLAIDKALIFIVNVELDRDSFGESDHIYFNGTFTSVEEFHFTPKLLKLVDLVRLHRRELEEVAKRKEEEELNKRYKGKFTFNGYESSKTADVGK
jgi:hypothetical protein